MYDMAVADLDCDCKYHSAVSNSVAPVLAGDDLAGMWLDRWVAE